jgi:hypothetical protein
MAPGKGFGFDLVVAMVIPKMSAEMVKREIG